MELKPLGVEIKMTQRVMKRFIDLQMQPVTPNLSGTEGMMLRTISRHEGGKTTANEIMATSRVNKSSTSQMLAQLSRKGYITMEVDPSDKRKKIISLTPSGCLAVEDMRQVLVSCEEEMAAGLSEEEVGAFRSVLAKIRENCLRKLGEDSEEESK